MNFYAIGPLAYLNAICGPEYRFHMCLAQHLYDTDFTPTDYFMFYRRRCSLNGYRVILDNGVYECHKLNNDYLLRATLELNPHVVVLPDVVGDMAATISGGELFKERLKANKWKGVTMTVLQAAAGDLDQHCHAYMEATKQSEWVGFPKRGKWGVDGRVEFAQELRNRGLWDARHKHHALGMVDGSYEELAAVAACGLFDGCDSSVPIWRSLVHESNLKFDPNYSPYTEFSKRIFEQTLELCKGGQTWKSTSARP